MDAERSGETPLRRAQIEGLKNASSARTVLGTDRLLDPSPPSLRSAMGGDLCFYRDVMPWSDFVNTPQPWAPSAFTPASVQAEPYIELHTREDSEEPDWRQHFEQIIECARNSGDLGVYVPQTIYSPLAQRDCDAFNDLDSPISFYNQSGRTGIVVGDALDGNTGALLQRDARVMHNGASISIRIMWPGYLGWTQTIVTRGYKLVHKSIKLGVLATTFAKAFSKFLKVKRREKQEHSLRWSALHFTTCDFVLESLHNVSRGSWQPHLRLLYPDESSSRTEERMSYLTWDGKKDPFCI